MSILESAIHMELDGEKFYEQQARLNSDSSVKKVCLLLAQEEKKHAQFLKNKQDKIAYKLIDTDKPTKDQSVFDHMGIIKSDIMATPTQLEFYKAALAIEQRSIDLYTDLLSKAETEEEKTLFIFLVEQEKRHFSMIDEMVTLLRHTQEWVESPEFGLRIEDY